MLFLSDASGIRLLQGFTPPGIRLLQGFTPSGIRLLHPKPKALSQPSSGLTIFLSVRSNKA